MFSTQGNPRFVKTKKGKIWDYFRTMHNKRAAGPILICKCSREFCCCVPTTLHHIFTILRYLHLYFGKGINFHSFQVDRSFGHGNEIVQWSESGKFKEYSTGKPFLMIKVSTLLYTLIHMWPTTPELLRIGISFHSRLRGSSLLFYDYYSQDQQGFFS